MFTFVEPLDYWDAGTSPVGFKSSEEPFWYYVSFIFKHCCKKRTLYY